MSKTLLVAEKPSVGKDIAKALPGSFKSNNDKTALESDDYVISWAIGHLLTLVEPEKYDPGYKKWKLETLPIVPNPFQIKPISGNGKKQLQALKKLFDRKDIKKIINACDAGREGELIFAYLYQYVAGNKPVQRLWLSSMTDEAIKKAFHDLRQGKEMEALQAAARSRSEADWLVGMNATRAASIKLRPAFASVVSLGRVQTPTLALIVKRELEIKAFQPEPYWQLEASFITAEKETYRGQYEHNKKFTDKKEAEKILAACQNASGVISSLKTKPFQEKPPLLFDLTSLQREANSKLGYTAKKTLAIAQKLYEEHKLLTYPRTNSRYLPNDQVANISAVAASLTNPEYQEAIKQINNSQQIRTDRAINDSKVSDHHAIIPTGKNKNNLDDGEKKVYDLVARRFLAAFLADASGQKTQLETTVAKQHAFHSHGKIYDQLGWRILYSKDTKEEELPLLQEKEQVTVKEIDLLDKMTKPPHRFSDASLLSAMETAGKELDDEELRETMKESGIGTPATRAAIIDRLLDVGYIEREQKSFLATEKGIKVIELLNNHLLTSPGLTGEWEKRLNQIEQGQEQRKRFMEDIAKFTTTTVEQLAKLEPPKFERATLGPCPHCGKPVVENRKGYSCWSKEDPGCGFVIWKVVAGKRLPETAIKELFNEGKTSEQVQGFKSRKGRSFKAKLKLIKNDKDKWQAVFDEEWAQ